MNMQYICGFCDNTIELMGEIHGTESEPLEPIYAALQRVVLVETCKWATFEPQNKTTGLARCIHYNMHRILLDNINEILSAANFEVRKRAIEYGIEEHDVSDRIQELIRLVSRYADKERRRYYGS